MLATRLVLALSTTVTLSIATLQAQTEPVESATPVRAIANIETFLDQCPNRDPAFSTIQLDFEIRRDGLPAAVPFCAEPVHTMSTAEYTNELIVLQGLRVMYYMDRGKSGHLPWTSLTLYDWMKTKIGGINIVSGGGSFCCQTFGGKTFIAVGAQDDFNREFDKKWTGIAGNIDLYAHEARHVDGFGHVSCCGIPNGCDSSFEQSNLSSYGVQWWLNWLWLNGTINVGMACMSTSERAEATSWFVSATNDQFRSRFCTNKPGIMPAPTTPGGPCTISAKHRSVRK